MEGLEHLEHLDKHLVDELAQVARETVRDELREQTRKQRRTAMLYAASGAVALYAGAALALTLGLALAIGLPDWAAALITAGILGAVAYLLRGMAHPAGARPTPQREAELMAAGQGDRAFGGSAPVTPQTGAGAPIPPIPPMPPVAPGGAAGAAGAPVVGEPGTGLGSPPPRQDDVDPEQHHHRA